MTEWGFRMTGVVDGFIYPELKLGAIDIKLRWSLGTLIYVPYKFKIENLFRKFGFVYLVSSAVPQNDYIAFSFSQTTPKNTAKTIL